LWTNSAGPLKTLRMGSSLDHLIANGYLYGFGYEPAMWSAVRASRARFPDQRTWPGRCPPGGQPLLCSWADAARAALPPGAARAAQPSSTNKAPQNAGESPPKPAAPPKREQRLTIPPSWGRAEPSIASPDLSCLPSPQSLTREIPQKSQESPRRGNAAAGTTPTGNLRPAREGLMHPDHRVGALCCPGVSRNARHADANASGVDRGISAAARVG
jgi:hypothetical protein